MKPLLSQPRETPARLIENVAPCRPAGAPCRLDFARIDKGEEPFTGPLPPCEFHSREEKRHGTFAAFPPIDAALDALLAVAAMLFLAPSAECAAIGGQEKMLLAGADDEFIDTPADIRDKYQYFTEANMGKLKSIGYDKPFHTLEEGVKDYVQNYLEEKNYY